MHRLTCAGTVVLGFCLPVSFVQAKENPCQEDIEKFCKEVQPGGGRIVHCLQQHQSELSDTCKQAGAELKGVLERVAEACQGDVEKLCSGVQPGEGRVLRCLKEHEAQLSDSCKNAGKGAKK